MEEHKPGILLVLGCQRSGTSLLAAMIGRHSELNMLYESTTGDVFKSIGKKYSGNKLLTWRQIRKSRRASMFGHFMNRLVNFDFGPTHRHHKLRPWPTSMFSIDDYIRHDAKIITLTRDKDEVVKSITSRTKMTAAQAAREYDLAMAEINTVRNMALNITFPALVHHPEETLKAICLHLGLDYEPRMLEGPKYNYVYPQEKIIRHKDSTREKTS